MDFRKNAILAKIESVYGTDAAPAGAADAVLCVVRSFKPMDNEMVEREVDLGGWFGHMEMLPVGTRVMLEIDCEMVGSGVVDTPAQWGKLVRVCGFGETVNAAVSVQYDPVSAGIPSASIYVHKDGVRHKVLGTRGTKLGLKVTPRGIPYFQLGFMGLYGGVADATFPTQTLTSWKTPIAVNNANTGSFTLHGYAGKLYDMQIDVAPETIYRNLVGQEDVPIVDRAPAGRIVIEEPTVATKDFWSVARTPTLAALTITHGVTGGFKVKIDAPNVQLLNPEREDRNGVSALAMGLRLKPGATGNDELRITSL